VTPVSHFGCDQARIPISCIVLYHIFIPSIASYIFHIAIDETVTTYT
jgi:hypothetical protein